MPISLLITFISNLMKPLSHQSLQIFWSLQTFQQHLSKVYKIKRKPKDQSVFSLSFQKFLKRLFASNSQITVISFYQNFNVVLEKATAPLYCLLLMIDNWKKAVDSHKVFGAVLTNISNIFHCICHDLLIAKFLLKLKVSIPLIVLRKKK